MMTTRVKEILSWYGSDNRGTHSNTPIKED